MVLNGETCEKPVIEGEKECISPDLDKGAYYNPNSGRCESCGFGCL